MARVLGHIFGDGCLQKDKKGYRVRYTNKQLRLVEDFKLCFEKSFPSTNTSVYLNRARNCWQFEAWSKKAYQALSAMVKNKQHVPAEIFNGSRNFKRHFIATFFDDEGTVVYRWYKDKKRGPSYDCWKREVSVCNTSLSLLQELKEIFTELGIKTGKIMGPYVSTRGGKSPPSSPFYRFSIYGKISYFIFSEVIPLQHPLKLERLRGLLATYKDGEKLVSHFTDKLAIGLDIVRYDTLRA